MAANGKAVRRAAINALSIEGPDLLRQPLGLRYTGPEVATRLSQRALDTTLLATCARATRVRCLTAPAKVVSAHRA